MHIDGTTFADLQVFSEADRTDGLSSLFLAPSSDAGVSRLRQRLRSPLSDVGELERVQAAVRYFAETWEGPVLTAGSLDDLRKYLNSRLEIRERRFPLGDIIDSIWLSLRERDVCGELFQGVHSAGVLVAASESLAQSLLRRFPPPLLQSLAESLLGHCELLREVQPSPSLVTTLRSDRYFRGQGRAQLNGLIDCLTEIDVLWAMGATTRHHSWVFPEFISANRVMVEAAGLYHPFLEAPVPNDLAISADEPVVFLTGPNMAGKTTYLRSVGLAVFLGQLGMGVPAQSFRLAPAEVLITSLNPTDNLQANGL